MKIIILTVLLLLSSCTKDSYARKLLPKGVTEIKEYYRDTGFSGDFIRLLKAKSSKEDYEVLATKLKLTEKFTDYVKTRKIMIRKRSIVNPPEWWDEPMDSNDYYFIKDISKEYEQRLKWKDGWLYLATEAW
jgi:hypothetical protein